MPVPVRYDADGTGLGKTRGEWLEAPTQPVNDE